MESKKNNQNSQSRKLLTKNVFIIVKNERLHKKINIKDYLCSQNNVTWVLFINKKKNLLTHIRFC